MAEAPDTLGTARLGGVGWIILVALGALSVLAGLSRVTTWAGAWFAAILFPPAAGLPELWPPLRFAPIGETTTAVWIIDLVGVAAMLVVAVLQLRAVSRKHPYPSRARAFGRGVWTTTVAFLAGNLVRGALQSFILHSDLGTYAGQMLGNLVVTCVMGVAVGIVVGLISMLAGAPARRAL